MSNRSLLEFNHDFSHLIEADQEAFVRALVGYFISGSRQDADENLSRYGIRLHGMRHHSEAYSIKWGCHLSKEPRQRTEGSQ